MKDSYCVSKMCSFLHFWKYSYFHIDWNQMLPHFCCKWTLKQWVICVSLNPRMAMFLRKEEVWSKTHNVNYSRENATVQTLSRETHRRTLSGILGRLSAVPSYQMDEGRWLSSSKTIKNVSEYPFNVPYVPFRLFAGWELRVCNLSVEFSNQTTHLLFVCQCRSSCVEGGSHSLF